MPGAEMALSGSAKQHARTRFVGFFRTLSEVYWVGCSVFLN